MCYSSDKASESLYGLRGVLDRPPSLPPPMSREGGVVGGGAYNAENADQSYGSAVERLRNMMHSIPPASADRPAVGVSAGGPKTVLFGGRAAPPRVWLVGSQI